MRVGQTSIIVFVSKLVAALLGFVATVYFARVLGAEILGLYAVVLALAGWIKIGGQVGVSKALTKRLSEGDEQSEYLAAAIILVTMFGFITSVAVMLFREQVNAYIGTDAALLVVLLVFVGLFHQIIRASLSGERLVHISGLLSPVRTGGRSAIQVGLVMVGFGLSGMVIGYAAGTFLAGILGIVFLSTHLKLPKKRHFVSLYDYAKYAWLGGIKSRTWSDIDILILAAFVPASLVGIYSIAWSIAKFLNLFGAALSKTIFPEISHAGTKENEAMVQSLIEGSLTFGGLILIPGLIGGTVLADRLLLIYGPEFTEGVSVLAILIIAYLIQDYWKQLMTAIKALDRPDLAFRINLVFIICNASLNVALIVLIGWIGAAIATGISVSVGLILAFRSLRGLVSFNVPVSEILQQWIAALLMGGVVYAARHLGEANLGWVDDLNAVFVVALVGLGAAVYFTILFGISTEFRTTVANNLPFDVPLITP